MKKIILDFINETDIAWILAVNHAWYAVLRRKHTPTQKMSEIDTEGGCSEAFAVLCMSTYTERASHDCHSGSG